MPDLGKYAGAVLGSYAGTLLLIAAILLLTFWQSRRVTRALAEVEGRVAANVAAARQGAIADSEGDGVDA